jgi:hypothetical protein
MPISQPGGGYLASAPGHVTLTYATPLTIDASNRLSQEITLTGNLTISAVNGLSDGQTLKLMVIQGGSGSYTVTWPTISWTAPTLSTTVGRMDWIAITRRGSGLVGSVIQQNTTL